MFSIGQVPLKTYRIDGGQNVEKKLIDHFFSSSINKFELVIIHYDPGCAHWTYYLWRISMVYPILIRFFRFLFFIT